MNMRWADVRKGDVLHWEGSDTHSYVVIGEVTYARHDRLNVPVLDLDKGQVYLDHYKEPDVEIKLPWRLECR